MSHVTRGDRFLAPRYAHIVAHELGSAASFAQAMVTELPWTDGPGVPSLEDVREELDERGAYYDLRTPLLWLENTHNHAGGSVIPLDRYTALVDLAHSAGMKVHLDGARVWHAAIAQGISVQEAVGSADTVSVCLSKGLGAPMGSVLAGPADLISNARRLRKMLGGGTRQVGVVAAAGLYALDHELPRLGEDHVRARRLAEGLRQRGFAVEDPDTNMVFVPVDSVKHTGESWARAGVLASSMGSAMRLVTSREIDDAAVDAAVERIAGAAE